MKKTVTILLIVISLFACDDADIDNGQHGDFRDQYIGLYRGIEITDHVGDTVTWEYDTTSFNIEIEVGKVNDTSFVVTIEDFSFQTDYHSGNRYICRVCTRGPWHYIEFIEKDSIIVSRYKSSFSGSTYYAKKE